MSSNVHRRNLDSSRLAMIGLDLLEMAEAEARTRKVDGGREAGRGRPKEKDVAGVPQPNGPRLARLRFGAATERPWPLVLFAQA